MIPNLSCNIYIDAPASTLNEALERHWSVNSLDATIQGNEIVLMKNLSFDSVKKYSFPNGFVYYQQLLEIYPDESCTPLLQDQVVFVSKLLEYLWSLHIPAVASCDFEDQLPNKGGYKSKIIPWAKT